MAVPLTAARISGSGAGSNPYRVVWVIGSNGVDDTAITFNHGVDFSNLSLAAGGSNATTPLPGLAANVSIVGVNADATPLFASVSSMTATQITITPIGATVAGGASYVTIERAAVNGW